MNNKNAKEKEIPKDPLAGESTKMTKATTKGKFLENVA